MSTFDMLADLPLEVSGYRLEGLRANVSSGFERLSTVVHLYADGAEGVGEDVVYDAEDHVALQQAGPVHDLSGSYTLGEFCRRVDELDLFPVAPRRGEVSRLYRRWTFHSAALDLALVQAGKPLHEVLERPAQPLTFVVSLRLGEPPSMAPIERRLARYPTLRFKLDPTSSWTPELIAELVATGAVDSVDFKSLYRGTIVDQPPDPVLYERVLAAFPNAWVEDPDVVTAETEAVLAAHHDRITWDAPIHSIDDIEALPFPPRMVNIKPSRIGGLAKLCATYDYCAEHGIGAYGGGQFELGPGRGQAQYLASLFHPHAPNDLAPGGYNQDEPPDGLPASPLPPGAVRDRVPLGSWGMSVLDGTVALVTGASSGIGEATAQALAAEGASVALLGRRADRLEQLASRLDGRSLVLAADVTAEPEAREAVERAVSELGRLDILVNNAGVMLLGSAADAPLEEWQRMLDVNVAGLLYCARAALPHLLKAAEDSPRGVSDMVNISSVAGRVARRGSAVYNLTKHGVGAFSEALRQEVADRHVRVSLVEPGAVDTELAGHNRPEVLETIKQRFADVERLQAEDIADAIRYIVTRPRHVAVNELLIRPTEQAD